MGMTDLMLVVGALFLFWIIAIVWFKFMYNSFSKQEESWRKSKERHEERGDSRLAERHGRYEKKAGENKDQAERSLNFLIPWSDNSG